MLAARSISEAALNAATAASWQPYQSAPPVWSKFLVATGLLVLLSTTVIMPLRIERRRLERRIYWGGWLVATPLIALSVLPRGLRGTVLAALLCALLALGQAYVDTPYLKIGGHIYAFTINDSRPDPPEDGTDPGPPPPRPTDSYDSLSGISARNGWWLVVGMTGLGTSNVLLVGWETGTVLGVAFIVACGALMGVDDAQRKLPRARGQWVQAYFITVISIPMWLLPPIAYLIGYQARQRWLTSKAAPPDGTVVCYDDMCHDDGQQS